MTVDASSPRSMSSHRTPGVGVSGLLGRQARAPVSPEHMAFLDFMVQDVSGGSSCHVGVPGRRQGRGQT